jgi:hypothetical protein
MQFIAAAREGWPAALKKIRELEGENRRLRKVLEAKGISYNDALIMGRHLEEMEYMIREAK